MHMNNYTEQGTVGGAKTNTTTTTTTNSLQYKDNVHDIHKEACDSFDDDEIVHFDDDIQAEVEIKQEDDFVYEVPLSGEDEGTELDVFQEVEVKEESSEEEIQVAEKRRPSSDNRKRPRPEEDDSEKIYACDKCEKVYAKMNSLYVHKQTHAEAKRFKCELCPFRAYRKYTRDMHQLIHQRNPNFHYRPPRQTE